MAEGWTLLVWALARYPDKRTPAQVTETLQRIVKQGAGRLTVNFADAPRPDGTLLFSERVLPAL